MSIHYLKALRARIKIYVVLLGGIINQIKFFLGVKKITRVKWKKLLHSETEEDRIKLSQAMPCLPQSPRE